MSSVKGNIETVEKVWGRETWIVNEPEYCCKFLYLNKNAQSSLHHHRNKKETFYSLNGQVALHIEGRDYMLGPVSRPKTILPYQKHQFWGITDAIILEVSTHHDEEDVVRFTSSKSRIYES